MSIAHTWLGRVISQQIRVDRVAGLGLGGARASIECLDPHPPHQRLHMPTADLASLGNH